MNHMTATRRRLTPVALAILLSGCASTSIEEQHRSLTQFGESHLNAKPQWLTTEATRTDARAQVDALLQQPLTPDAATRIALSYSPAYQALLADQTATSANITQSARLPNPVFAFERLLREGGGTRELEINRSLTIALLDLIMLPRTLELADMRQSQLRVQAASTLLQTVTEVRMTWVRAVAAAQASAYFAQVMETAEASAGLAKRMEKAGNFSRLQQAREQAFYADAKTRLARARMTEGATREALIRTLGLDAEQQKKLSLPDHLPALPDSALEEKIIMQTALDERLDVQLAKSELNRIAKSQGLTTVASYVNGLDLKGEHNSVAGLPQKGYEIDMPLPLFDWGDARREEARARYLAALNRAAQTSVNASSQTRLAYGEYRTNYDLAKQYQDEIVPLKKAITDEMLLRYNGMLVGVFDLLADAREQIGSVIGALDAQRDFWLADATLHATLLGQPGSQPTE
jgi:outer membrane protein TolC